MGESTDPNPDPSTRPEQVRLDYARPAGGLPPAVQLTLGAIFALAVVMPLTVFAPFVIGMPGVVVGPLVGVAIVGAIAHILRRSGRSRPWAAGVWVGVGIALLTDGICWIALTQRLR